MGFRQFFEEYIQKKPFFIDREVLQSHYLPDEILHREEQLTAIASILAPCLRLEKPSNLFIYGKTGTGKTLCIKHILQSMNETAQQNGLLLKTIYLNCKLKRIADTEYRLLAQLAQSFGKEIPPTGLPTDEVYNIFYKVVDEKKQVVILVLDEIDQLIAKIGDEVLYNFTRINAELANARLCIVGVSNNLIFVDHLDPRVKSSLSEEELIFPPYNAIQINAILTERVAKAFQPHTLETGVIEKCSAYAAREHGDVRRAIDLIRVAGELAERSGHSTVTFGDLDAAEKKIESERVTDAIVDQPKQFQAVVYAIILVAQHKNNFFTGEIYDAYQTICQKMKWSVLTQRRVSDILTELDLSGIIHAKIISKGRYGRMREIQFAIDGITKNKVRELLEKSLNLV